MLKTHVIIAHYNENLDWTKNLIYPYTIVSRNNIPKEVAPNKGYEASAYLEYIINNYENLPDICIFVHGHRNDWHHKENIDEKIKNLDFSYNYYNINELKTDYLKNHIKEFSILKNYIYIFNNILNKQIIVQNIKYKPCAQFYVKKENILIHSIDIYKKLYNFLMTTNIHSFWSARFFEYLWHFIFTNNYEDID
tara:strand:+ start:782 stop:1363 length:582 start_codon:yes stop_codon:yes gene_type:complete